MRGPVAERMPVAFQQRPARPEPVSGSSPTRALVLSAPATDPRRSSDEPTTIGSKPFSVSIDSSRFFVSRHVDGDVNRRARSAHRGCSHRRGGRARRPGLHPPKLQSQVAPARTKTPGWHAALGSRGMLGEADVFLWGFLGDARTEPEGIELDDRDERWVGAAQAPLAVGPLRVPRNSNSAHQLSQNTQAWCVGLVSRGERTELPAAARLSGNRPLSTIASGAPWQPGAGGGGEKPEPLQEPELTGSSPENDRSLQKEVGLNLVVRVRESGGRRGRRSSEGRRIGY